MVSFTTEKYIEIWNAASIEPNYMFMAPAFITVFNCAKQIVYVEK
jgi:hypothetical protein